VWLVRGALEAESNAEGTAEGAERAEKGGIHRRDAEDAEKRKRERKSDERKEEALD